jgi:hypothetical protein
VKLTIIPSDNMVYIDGTALRVDCSSVADSGAPGVAVHAVQWNGSTGWIEYVGDDRPPNRTITDIAQFQSVVDAWANAQAVAAAAASAATAATPVVKP